MLDAQFGIAGNLLQEVLVRIRLAQVVQDQRDFVGFDHLAAAAGVLIWQRKNLALLKYVGADEETVLAQQQENERTDETIRQEYQIPEVALSEQDGAVYWHTSYLLQPLAF